MITESDVYRENRSATIAWALLASLFTNLLGWVVALFFVNWHVAQPQIEEREYAVASSSITLSRRVVPKPNRVVVPPAQPQPQPQPRKQRQQRVAIVKPNGTQPIQRQTQNVAPQLQTQFNAPAHAPISIATIEPQPPSTYQRTFMDLNGVDPREHVEALLEPSPENHRIEEGESCYYYVHYSAQWSGGGSEEGTIPWPICYPADHDAMLPLGRTHALPIPEPPPYWRLPPGTPLSPLLFSLYQRQIHA